MHIWLRCQGLLRLGHLSCRIFPPDMSQGSASHIAQINEARHAAGEEEATTPECASRLCQRLHIFDKRSVDKDNFMHAGDPIAPSLLGRPVPQLAHCLPVSYLYPFRHKLQIDF